MYTKRISYKMNFIGGRYDGLAIDQAFNTVGDAVPFHLESLRSQTPTNPGVDFTGNTYFVTDIVVEDITIS